VTFTHFNLNVYYQCGKYLTKYKNKRRSRIELRAYLPYPMLDILNIYLWVCINSGISRDGVSNIQNTFGKTITRQTTYKYIALYKITQFYTK
jgi:hypothetical protein